MEESHQIGDDPLSLFVNRTAPVDTERLSTNQNRESAFSRRRRRSRFRVSPDRGNGQNNSNFNNVNLSKPIPPKNERIAVSPLKTEKVREHARALVEVASIGSSNHRKSKSSSAYNMKSLFDESPTTKTNSKKKKKKKKDPRKDTSLLPQLNPQLPSNDNGGFIFNPTFPQQFDTNKHDSENNSKPQFKHSDWDTESYFSNESESIGNGSGSIGGKNDSVPSALSKSASADGPGNGNALERRRMRQQLQLRNNFVVKTGEGDSNTTHSSSSNHKKKSENKLRRRQYHIVDEPEDPVTPVTFPKLSSFEHSNHSFGSTSRNEDPSPYGEESRTSPGSSGSFYFDAFGLEKQIDSEVSQWMNDIDAANEPEIHKLGIQASEDIASFFDESSLHVNIGSKNQQTPPPPLAELSLSTSYTDSADAPNITFDEFEQDEGPPLIPSIPQQSVDDFVVLRQEVGRKNDAVLDSEFYESLNTSGSGATLDTEGQIGKEYGARSILSQKKKKQIFNDVSTDVQNISQHQNVEENFVQRFQPEEQQQHQERQDCHNEDRMVFANFFQDEGQHNRTNDNVFHENNVNENLSKDHLSNAVSNANEVRGKYVRKTFDDINFDETNQEVGHSLKSFQYSESQRKGHESYHGQVDSAKKNIIEGFAEQRTILVKTNGSEIKESNDEKHERSYQHKVSFGHEEEILQPHINDDTFLEDKEDQILNQGQKVFLNINPIKRFEGDRHSSPSNFDHLEGVQKKHEEYDRNKKGRVKELDGCNKSDLHKVHDGGRRKQDSHKSHGKKFENDTHRRKEMSRINQIESRSNGISLHEEEYKNNNRRLNQGEVIGSEASTIDKHINPGSNSRQRIRKNSVISEKDPLSRKLSYMVEKSNFVEERSAYNRPTPLKIEENINLMEEADQMSPSSIDCTPTSSNISRHIPNSSSHAGFNQDQVELTSKHDMVKPTNISSKTDVSKYKIEEEKEQFQMQHVALPSNNITTQNKKTSSNNCSTSSDKDQPAIMKGKMAGVTLDTMLEHMREQVDTVEKNSTQLAFFNSTVAYERPAHHQKPPKATRTRSEGISDEKPPIPRENLSKSKQNAYASKSKMRLNARVERERQKERMRAKFKQESQQMKTVTTIYQSSREKPNELDEEMIQNIDYQNLWGDSKSKNVSDGKTFVETKAYECMLQRSNLRSTKQRIKDDSSAIASTSSVKKEPTEIDLVRKKMRERILRNSKSTIRQNDVTSVNETVEAKKSGKQDESERLSEADDGCSASQRCKKKSEQCQRTGSDQNSKSTQYVPMPKDERVKVIGFNLRGLHETDPQINSDRPYDETRSEIIGNTSRFQSYPSIQLDKRNLYGNFKDARSNDDSSLRGRSISPLSHRSSATKTAKRNFRNRSAVISQRNEGKEGTGKIAEFLKKKDGLKPTSRNRSTQGKTSVAPGPSLFENVKLRQTASHNMALDESIKRCNSHGGDEEYVGNDIDAHTSISSIENSDSLDALSSSASLKHVNSCNSVDESNDNETTATFRSNKVIDTDRNQSTSQSQKKEIDVAMMIRRRIAKNKDQPSIATQTMLSSEKAENELSNVKNKLKKVRITNPPPPAPPDVEKRKDAEDEKTYETSRNQAPQNKDNELKKCLVDACARKPTEQVKKADDLEDASGCESLKEREVEEQNLESTSTDNLLSGKSGKGKEALSALFAQKSMSFHRSSSNDLPKNIDSSVLEKEERKLANTKEVETSEMNRKRPDSPGNSSLSSTKFLARMKENKPISRDFNFGTKEKSVADVLNQDGKEEHSQLDTSSEAVDKGLALKDDPKYAKYFKMMKVGLPLDTVKHAMMKDGLDPDVLDGDHSKAVGVPLKEDPTYEKYFKMLKIGLPLAAVKHSMQRDGLDSSVMDGDHNAPVGSTPEKAKLKEKVPKDTHRRTRLHWDTLNKVRRNSVWALVNEDPDVEQISIDEKEFAQLFQTEIKASPSVAITAVEKEKSSNVVKVIDPKRANNGGIILARIKATYEDMAIAVDTMNDNVLNQHQLSGIMEYLPTSSEAQALNSYLKEAGGNHVSGIQSLCETEKFMVSMLNIKHARRKVRALIFKMQFINCIDEVLNDANAIAEACDQLSKSVRFRKLLGIVLNIGNRLNTAGPTKKGKAGAFTLDSLLKLNQAKAFDKKTTFLHYVILIVKRNNEQLLNFKDDLPAVLKAEKVYWDQCLLDLEEAENQLENVRMVALHITKTKNMHHWAAKRRRKPAGDDNCSISDMSITLEEEVMALRSSELGVFTLGAIKKVSALRDRVEKTKITYGKLLEYFGEDEDGGMQPHELFEIIVTFCRNFDTSLKEVEANEKAKARAEKKKNKPSKADEEHHRNNVNKTKKVAARPLRVSSMQPNMGNVLKDIQSLGKKMLKSASNVKAPIDTNNKVVVGKEKMENVEAVELLKTDTESVSSRNDRKENRVSSQKTHEVPSTPQPNKVSAIDAADSPDHSYSSGPTATLQLTPEVNNKREHVEDLLDVNPAPVLAQPISSTRNTLESPKPLITNRLHETETSCEDDRRRSKSPHNDRSQSNRSHSRDRQVRPKGRVEKPQLQNMDQEEKKQHDHNRSESPYNDIPSGRSRSGKHEQTRRRQNNGGKNYVQSDAGVASVPASSSSRQSDSQRRGELLRRRRQQARQHRIASGAANEQFSPPPRPVRKPINGTQLAERFYSKYTSNDKGSNVDLDSLNSFTSIQGQVGQVEWPMNSPKGKNKLPSSDHGGNSKLDFELDVE